MIARLAYMHCHVTPRECQARMLCRLDCYWLWYFLTDLVSINYHKAEQATVQHSPMSCMLTKKPNVLVPWPYNHSYTWFKISDWQYLSALSLLKWIAYLNNSVCKPWWQKLVARTRALSRSRIRCSLVMDQRALLCRLVAIWSLQDGKVEDLRMRHRPKDCNSLLICLPILHLCFNNCFS